MDIPPTCSQWEAKMAAGNEQQRKILDNVRSDPCVDDRLAQAFFAELAAKGAPQDGVEAHGYAVAVVRSNALTLTCQGQQVPHGSFDMLFRLEDILCLRYRISDVLDELGITDASLDAGLPDEDLRAVTDEWDGPVTLGNALAVVWVADYAAIAALLADLGSLLIRLGIAGRAGVRHYIICVYEKTATRTTLHAPRVLDGINMENFRPNPDCTAGHGVTRPLTNGATGGLPEAVHRSCSLIPMRWELGTI